MPAPTTREETKPGAVVDLPCGGLHVPPWPGFLIGDEMTAKRADDLFHACPGSWFGNMPHDGQAYGNVVVNPARIDPALRFLRRRFRVIRTAIYVAPNPGIVIEIEPKAKVV